MLKTISPTQRLQNSGVYFRNVQGNQVASVEPNKILELFDTPKVQLGKAQFMNQNSTDAPIELFNSYVVSEKLDYDLDGASPDVGIIVNNNAGTCVIYTGMQISACANLCLFGQPVFKEDTALRLDVVSMLLDKGKEKIIKEIDQFKDFRDQMMSKVLGDQEFIELKGKILSKAPTNLLRYVVDAEAILRNKSKSNYKDWDNTQWLYYNAITEGMNKSIKTPMLVRDIEHTFNSI